MANAYTTRRFNYLMIEVNKINSRVSRYLMEIGYDRWCRVHAKAKRSFLMMLNIVEFVNSAKIRIQDMLILHLLEFIKKIVQKLNFSNKNITTNTTIHLFFMYQEIIIENMKVSILMKVK